MMTGENNMDDSRGKLAAHKRYVEWAMASVIFVALLIILVALVWWRSGASIALIACSLSFSVGAFTIYAHATQAIDILENQHKE